MELPLFPLQRRFAVSAECHWFSMGRRLADGRSSPGIHSDSLLHMLNDLLRNLWTMFAAPIPAATSRDAYRGCLDQRRTRGDRRSRHSARYTTCRWLVWVTKRPKGHAARGGPACLLHP